MCTTCGTCVVSSAAPWLSCQSTALLEGQSSMQKGVSFLRGMSLIASLYL